MLFVIINKKWGQFFPKKVIFTNSSQWWLSLLGLHGLLSICCFCYDSNQVYWKNSQHEELCAAQIPRMEIKKLACEFLHESSICLLLQMIWYTENNCRVSLHCEFLHATSNRHYMQMIWDTANSCKVSLQCELSYAALKCLNA